MNKHRAHWSVMGIEPQTEKSTKQNDFEEFAYKVKVMVGKYGKHDTLGAVLRAIANTSKESEE